MKENTAIEIASHKKTPNKFLKLVEENKNSESEAKDDELSVKFREMFRDVEPNQEVSRWLPERKDLEDLYKQVDDEMERRLGKQTTICAIRKEIHNWLFDELLRQMTLINPLQADLLWRIKVEAEQSLETWKKLCAQGQRYGNRVYNQIDPNERTVFDKRCRKIQREIDRLEGEVIALKAKLNFAYKARDEQIGVEGEELKNSRMTEAARRKQCEDMKNVLLRYNDERATYPDIKKLADLKFEDQDELKELAEEAKERVSSLKKKEITNVSRKNTNLTFISENSEVDIKLFESSR